MIQNYSIKKYTWTIVFSSLFLLLINLPARATIIQMDPRATFLHTNNDPGALDPMVIDLNNFGINVGDQIELSYTGNCSFYNTLSLRVYRC